MGHTEMKAALLAICMGVCVLVLAKESPSGETDMLDDFIAELEAEQRAGRIDDEKQRALHAMRRLKSMQKGDGKIVRDRVAVWRKELGEFLSSRAVCMVSASDRQRMCACADLLDDVVSGRKSPEALRELNLNQECHSGDIYVEKSALRCGDLIFTRYESVWSQSLVMASMREKRFSHVGIVLRVNDKVELMSVGADEITGVGCVSRRIFTELRCVARDLAVYRYTGPDAEAVRERIARAAERRIGTPFDPAFDLKTKDRLYCTELVRDCVNEAAGREVIGTSRKGDFEYVAVDDCYRNEMTKVWDARDIKATNSDETKCPNPLLDERRHPKGPKCNVDGARTNGVVRRTIRFVPRTR